MSTLRLVRRHSTLLAFSLSLAGSTAFVACGSDSESGAGGQPTYDAGSDSGTGGAGGGSSGGAGGGGTGGTSSGGTSSGGTSSGGTSSGGTSSGGAGGSTMDGAVSDAEPDAPTSNGDAASDATVPDDAGG